MNRILIGFLALAALIAAAFIAYTLVSSDGRVRAPAPEPPPGWALEQTPGGIEFAYPESLQTTYISAQEWPPRIEATDDRYACSGGAVTTGDGALMRTEQKTINGRDYCVGVASEGAAGSTYRTYEYATAIENSTLRVTLTLRFPQCLNYDDPNQSACATEQERFDLDQIVDRIVGTVRMP